MIVQPFFKKNHVRQTYQGASSDRDTVLGTTGLRQEPAMSALRRAPWPPHPSRLYRYVHSRLRRLDVEPETVDDVMKEYGLVLSGRPRNLPMGWRNHCVVVDTNIGRKVLKQYRSQWQVDTVLCEHSILTRLARLRIPATRLVRTLESQTYVTRPSGIFALFDYVDGNTYSLTLIPNSLRQELVKVAGKGLARIHRELDGFVPQGKHHLGFRFYGGQRQRTVSWYEERLSRLIEKSDRLSDARAKELARPLVQAGSDIADQLRSLDSVLSETNLPRVVIHGDYGFHNLIFHEGSRLTVLDFELARIEWRLYDIVMVLVRSWRSGLDNNSAARMRAFLSGYEMEYPLTPIEQQMFEQVWTFENLQFAVKHWNSYFENGYRPEKLARAGNALEMARQGARIADLVHGLRNAK